MKHLSTAFLISCLFIFNSCSDSDNDIIEEPNPVNQYETGIDLTTYSELKSDNRNLKKETRFSLGYGYDITSKYAHSDGIREKVIDLSKMGYYDIYESEATFEGTLFMYEGSAESIKKQILSELTGVDLDEKEIAKLYKNAFKDMLKTPFLSDTTFTNLDYYYNLEASAFEVYSSRLNFVLRQLSAYLTESFISDLESLEPNLIIEKYGTHLMTSIEYGFRKDFAYRSTSSRNLVNRKIGAMEYILDTYELYHFSSDKEKTNEEKENFHIEYVGGLPKNTMMPSWMFDVTNYNKSIKYEFIKQTSDEENLTLIDFGRNNSLIPIYELITDNNNKKEAIKKAFEDYLSK